LAGGKNFALARLRHCVPTLSNPISFATEEPVMNKLKLFLTLWLAIVLLSLAASAQTPEGKRHAIRTFTKNIEFSSQGVIQIVPGVGAKLTNGYAKGARRLFLRIGIGEISVRKLGLRNEPTTPNQEKGESATTGNNGKPTRP
jgi:hypothetical protein